jgi:hypothetical protein
MPGLTYTIRKGETIICTNDPDAKPEASATANATAEANTSVTTDDANAEAIAMLANFRKSRPRSDGTTSDNSVSGVLGTSWWQRPS